MSSQNDLILQRLTKIEQKIDELYIYFLGENKDDFFKGPTKNEINGRVNTSAILNEIKELNKKIDKIETDINNK